ncbi:hypothetical protein POTOM_016001 [Populus tomentosa]|uniref:Uncharacterized protein n=1 Tax=Populus tomentosa TaxID=118781 RepID=A0A8X7ZYL7_POPTO|nr:hypothetical protein POTOM_016001 [Populus tomentosa]
MVVVSRFRHSITLKSQHALTAAVDSEMQTKNLTTFSFNSTLLPTAGFADEVALFWGLQAYNNELLQADHRQLGSVSTEILFEKDSQACSH